MYAVRAGGARHIGAVVDEEARRRVARYFGRARGQLVQGTSGQILFAELNEGDSGPDGRADEV